LINLLLVWISSTKQNPISREKEMRNREMIKIRDDKNKIRRSLKKREQNLVGLFFCG